MSGYSGALPSLYFTDDMDSTLLSIQKSFELPVSIKRMDFDLYKFDRANNILVEDFHTFVAINLQA